MRPLIKITTFHGGGIIRYHLEKVRFRRHVPEHMTLCEQTIIGVLI